MVQRGMYHKTVHDYIEEGIPLVHKIASWMLSQYPSHISKDDIVQIGMEGLLHAAQNYDSSLGIFSHYASGRIRGAILDSLRQEDVLPRHMRDKVDILKKHAGVSRTEILKITSWTESELVDVELASTWQSVDIVDDEGSNLLDLIPDNGDSPDAVLEKKEMITLLVELIDKLPEREKMIISLYYDEECNLKEIAAILDLTESRVSQLLKGTIAAIRSTIQKK